MDKKKAIDILEKHINDVCRGCMHPQEVGWCENYCQLLNAFNTAIKALEPHEVTDTDTVSR